TPVRVDRHVLEADLRILTGRITHHYFAGFSGGRKSILPGISARATILANHRRVLDPDSPGQVHSQVFGGNLVGNPVHEDMVQAARMVGPVWILNTLLDRRHRITHAFAGELEEAHLAGCREAERLFFFPDPEPVPVVVASAGGFPFDLNLIQGLKALFNHREAVAPGGVFILVAESAGGFLTGMKQWLCWTDKATLGPAMAASYNLAAHNCLMLRQILEAVTVILVSALPGEEVEALGLLPASSLSEALAMARGKLGRRSELRVIHDGNVTQSGRRRGRIGHAAGVADRVQVARRAS
ncbi:MAG TPA: lactate racemase domain-containing protein, partial [Candidatus Methylomirabilis sp.]